MVCVVRSSIQQIIIYAIAVPIDYRSGAREQTKQATQCPKVASFLCMNRINRRCSWLDGNWCQGKTEAVKSNFRGDVEFQMGGWGGDICVKTWGWWGRGSGRCQGKNFPGRANRKFQSPTAMLSQVCFEYCKEASVGRKQGDQGGADGGDEDRERVGGVGAEWHSVTRVLTRFLCPSRGARRPSRHCSPAKERWYGCSGRGSCFGWALGFPDEWDLRWQRKDDCFQVLLVVMGKPEGGEVGGQVGKDQGSLRGLSAPQSKPNVLVQMGGCSWA